MKTKYYRTEEIDLDVTGGEGEANLGGGGATGSETPEQLFDLEAIPEEHREVARGYQASYTKKMQQLADDRRAIESQRQQYEGIDTTAAREYQQLVELAQSDPGRAAQLLDGYARQLNERANTQGYADPLGNFTPITDTEQQLAQAVRALQQQVQQQQTISSRNGQVVGLERQIGRQLNQDEQGKLATYMDRNGIGDAGIAWRAMNYDQDIAKAKQKGVDQGAGIVREKLSTTGAPSTRAAPLASGAPKTLREALAQTWEELES
ncbi:MAG: hypothetical protein ACREJW_00775 [Candidatus Methylomirabilales bacterium]